METPSPCWGWRTCRWARRSGRSWAASSVRCTRPTASGSGSPRPAAEIRGAVGPGHRRGHGLGRGPARGSRGHRRRRCPGGRRWPKRPGIATPQRHPHRRLAADLGARDLCRRRRRQRPAPLHRGAPPQRALVQCPQRRQGGSQGDARPGRRAGHHPVLLHGPVRRQHGVLRLPDARCRPAGHPRLARGQGVHCLLAARRPGDRRNECQLAPRRQAAEGDQGAHQRPHRREPGPACRLLGTPGSAPRQLRISSLPGA